MTNQYASSILWLDHKIDLDEVYIGKTHANNKKNQQTANAIHKQKRKNAHIELSTQKKNKSLWIKTDKPTTQTTMDNEKTNQWVATEQIVRNFGNGWTSPQSGHHIEENI